MTGNPYDLHTHSFSPIHLRQIHNLCALSPVCKFCVGTNTRTVSNEREKKNRTEFSPSIFFLSSSFLQYVTKFLFDKRVVASKSFVSVYINFYLTHLYANLFNNQNVTKKEKKTFATTILNYIYVSFDRYVVLVPLHTDAKKQKIKRAFLMSSHCVSVQTCVMPR